MPDALTLLTQAMSSLIASVEDDKRSRRQAEAERKQEERERREFDAKAEAERKQEERERWEFEAKAEAERKQEERERREFEDARLRHWEQIEKDRQARLESLEGSNAEREAAAIEAHTKASEIHKAQHQTDLASQKKQAILQALPKLDDHTDPEAFLATFEEAMEEGDFLMEEWMKNIRKLLTGKASSIYYEMNVTAETPYLVFKTSLLERLGYTETRTRHKVWRSSPGDQQSPRNHLTPILKGITRLAKNICDRQDHIKEQLFGVLTCYYSSEVCHSLKGKNFDSVYQIVDELEASWESKSFSECMKMHRKSPDGYSAYRCSREYWGKPKEQQLQHTNCGEGGHLTKGKGWGKPAGHSPGVGKRESDPVDQGTPPFSKPIIRFNCGKPWHTRRDCRETKVRLGRINSGSETNEFPDLIKLGIVNGKPCRTLIDTGAI